MEGDEIMTPERAEEMLTNIERTIRRSKQTDTVTKYQVTALFNYVRKLIRYQIPTPPIEVSEDGHKFTCATCGTAFDSDDHVDDFTGCYICLQRWK